MSKEDTTLPASVLAGEQGNQRGVNIEQKVSGLIKGLPVVASVVETKKWSNEDRDMIDLIVTLNGNSGLVVGIVYVQVKASTKGVEHFEEELTARLKCMKKAAGPVGRKAWMLENHRILLNGDIVMSKSHKHTRQISDTEIVTDFLAQLKDISDFEKAKITGF